MGIRVCKERPWRSRSSLRPPTPSAAAPARARAAPRARRGCNLHSYPLAAASRAPPGSDLGLFGLGAPIGRVIAGVALVILGPDKVKDLATEVGKASAELKQVPEEFAKGMEADAPGVFPVAKMPPART